MPPIPEAWGLVVESLADAAAQMALDQTLAESVWRGLRPPTLRLYRWPAPGITLGRHQPPGPVSGPVPGVAARRITGGHAVFHDNELTFSLALPAAHRLLREGPKAAYRAVAAACEDALSRLGLEVTRGNPKAPRRPERVFSCFTGATREETAVDGHKLVAIAQRLTRHGLLVQGCIPLSAPRHLPGASRSGVLGLDRLLPEVNWESVAVAMKMAFSERLGARFLSSPVGAGERAAVLRMTTNGQVVLSRYSFTHNRGAPGSEKTPKEALLLTEKWTEGPRDDQPVPNRKTGGSEGRIPRGSGT